MVSRQSGNYRDRAEWLEDILAGLLINGVRRDEVEVHHYPDGLTSVVVRGERRYSYQIVVVGP